MTNLVFLDTETDGVHAGRQVWEIGMIRRLPDGTESETQFFVDVDLSGADLFGLNIGRFYERHPLGREIAEGVIAETPVSRAEAAKRVAVWTHGAHIIGAVPNFDTETLAPLLREAGLVPSWHYHLTDVENLAAGYLAAEAVYYERRQEPAVAEALRKAARPPWKSDDLSAKLGVTVTEDDRHTALGDARWAMRVYDAVMGGRP